MVGIRIPTVLPCTSRLTGHWRISTFRTLPGDWSWYDCQAVSACPEVTGVPTFRSQTKTTTTTNVYRRSTPKSQTISQPVELQIYAARQPTLSSCCWRCLHRYCFASWSWRRRYPRRKCCRVGRREWSARRFWWARWDRRGSGRWLESQARDANGFPDILVNRYVGTRDIQQSIWKQEEKLIAVIGCV